MCGSSNPTPTTTPEVLTREKLNSMIAEVTTKAVRLFNDAPFMTVHERDLREIIQAINAMQSKLATMTIPTSTAVSNPARPAVPANEVPASTLDDINRAIDGVFNGEDNKRKAQVIAEALTALYYRLPRGASLEAPIHRLSILARNVGRAMQSQQPAAPSFDLTEEQEKHILDPDLDEIDGLASALTRLWEAAPENSRLKNALDRISDAAIALDDDDEEDYLSESTKDRVLNEIEDLDDDATPLDHAQNLRDALGVLHTRASWGSDLEAMAEGLRDEVDALIATLNEAKKKTGLDIKLTINGKEISLSK